MTNARRRIGMFSPGPPFEKPDTSAMANRTPCSSSVNVFQAKSHFTSAIILVTTPTTNARNQRIQIVVGIVERIRVNVAIAIAAGETSKDVPAESEVR